MLLGARHVPKREPELVRSGIAPVPEAEPDAVDPKERVQDERGRQVRLVLCVA